LLSLTARDSSSEEQNPEQCRDPQRCSDPPPRPVDSVGQLQRQKDQKQTFSKSHFHLSPQSGKTNLFVCLFHQFQIRGSIRGLHVTVPPTLTEDIAVSSDFQSSELLSHELSDPLTSLLCVLTGKRSKHLVMDRKTEVRSESSLMEAHEATASHVSARTLNHIVERAIRSITVNRKPPTGRSDDVPLTARHLHKVLVRGTSSLLPVGGFRLTVIERIA